METSTVNSEREHPDPTPVHPGKMKEAARGAARGAVAAMAMSGMRTVTGHVGLVEDTPPSSVLAQTVPGLLVRIPKPRRPAAVELVHWAYGATFGALFGLLPGAVRRAAWTGPAYGMLIWLSFEAGIAPILGLPQARRPRLGQRIALMGDHLLYGLVLSEPHRRDR